MNKGNILTCKRLQRVFDILVYYYDKDIDGVTTLTIDIVLREDYGIKNLAIGTTVSELRQNGCNIPRAKYIGKTDNGNKIYKYKLISTQRGSDALTYRRRK